MRGGKRPIGHNWIVTSSGHYTGDLVMYTGDPDRQRGLLDFVVRFTHGRVEWIRRLEQGESPRGRRPLEPA